MLVGELVGERVVGMSGRVGVWVCAGERGFQMVIRQCSGVAQQGRPARTWYRAQPESLLSIGGSGGTAASQSSRPRMPPAAAKCLPTFAAAAALNA